MNELQDQRRLLKDTLGGYDGDKVPARSLADEEFFQEMQASSIPTLHITDSDHFKARWEEMYRYFGYHGSARHLTENELDTLYVSKATFSQKKKDMHWTTKTMRDILDSTYARLLQSVMLSNLALNRRNDKALAPILDKVWTQPEYQPGIYHQLLVYDTDRSPVVDQLFQAIKYILGYIRGCNHSFGDEIKARDMNLGDDRLANEVDNLKDGKYTVPLKIKTRSPGPIARRYGKTAMSSGQAKLVSTMQKPLSA